MLRANAVLLLLCVLAVLASGSSHAALRDDSARAGIKLEPRRPLDDAGPARLAVEQVEGSSRASSLPEVKPGESDETDSDERAYESLLETARSATGPLSLSKEDQDTAEPRPQSKLAFTTVVPASDAPKLTGIRLSLTKISHYFTLRTWLKEKIRKSFARLESDMIRDTTRKCINPRFILQTVEMSIDLQSESLLSWKGAKGATELVNFMKTYQTTVDNTRDIPRYMLFHDIFSIWFPNLFWEHFHGIPKTVGGALNKKTNEILKPRFYKFSASLAQPTLSTTLRHPIKYLRSFTISVIDLWRRRALKPVVKWEFWDRIPSSLKVDLLSKIRAQFKENSGFRPDILSNPDIRNLFMDHVVMGVWDKTVKSLRACIEDRIDVMARDSLLQESWTLHLLRPYNAA